MKIERKIVLSNVFNVGLIVLTGLFAFENMNRVLTKLRFVEIADDLNASFLERYHIAPDPPRSEAKRTMLARLGDLLTPYCTILVPIPASRERTHLARERNGLAAQRTIAACHRTLYARSRTGLALVRTGVAVASFGVGLIQYFEPGVLTVVEAALVAVGVLMVIDGALWHLPVREEVPEVPRCAVL